ncbi:MAG: lytic transglycosylase domain-containing protein [Pseudomonadota bacterium]
MTPRRAGDGPRINIFIGDDTLDEGPAAPPPVVRRAPEAVTNDRFWTVVSPTLASASPERLTGAVSHALSHPKGQINQAVLRRVAREHGPEFERAGQAARVSPAFLLAVAYVESRGRRAAVSPAGAVGVMQLMPGTAARFGVQDSRNAAQNIRGGATYLDTLLQLFRDDALLALAGYNAGENAVIRRSAVPPFKETRAYVPAVLAAWASARTLCLVPPAGVRDGCTFSETALAGS